MNLLFDNMISLSLTRSPSPLLGCLEIPGIRRYYEALFGVSAVSPDVNVILLQSTSDGHSERWQPVRISIIERRSVLHCQSVCLIPALALHTFIKNGHQPPAMVSLPCLNSRLRTIINPLSFCSAPLGSVDFFRRMRTDIVHIYDHRDRTLCPAVSVEVLAV